MEEKNKESYSKYERREMFWSEQSLNQLGYSINFFLTIGLGFLAFLISERSSYPKFQIIKGADIEWKLVFYYLTLLILFISLLYGCTSIISRLYDLRITRHITGIRKITLKTLDQYLPEGELDLSKEKLPRVFFKTICNEINFIHVTEDSDFKIISRDFVNLRKQVKLLGRITWYAHKKQILFILIATLICGITIL
jgi:hypothetical protein